MSNFSVTYKKKFIDTPEGPMALPQPEGPSTGQQILGAGTGAVKTSLKIGDIVNKQRNAQLARITGDAADPRLKFKATDPAMGVDMPKVTIEVNGEKQEVYKLTELNKDDLLGLPVMSFLGETRPWKGKDGNMRTNLEVRSYRKWEGGVKKDVLEDIQF